MLHTEIVDINNYAKISRDCIPMSTHKYLTQQITNLYKEFYEIDKTLNDRTSKIEPTELSQFRLEQKAFLKKIKGYAEFLGARHTIIEIDEQEERCLVGNGIDLLMGSLKTPKKVYYDVIVTCKDTISVDSPLGRVIYGQPVGTTVQFFNPVSGKYTDVVINGITSHKNAKKIFFNKNKEKREDGMRLQAS